MIRTRPALLAAVLLAATGIAAADPLTELLAKGNGTACYEKTFDEAYLVRHQAQRTHAVQLSLRSLQGTTDAVARIRIDHEDDAFYIVGRCGYSDNANADVLGNRVVEAFRGKAGLGCQATTRLTGSTSAEGGDFLVALGKDGGATLYLPETLSAWTSPDRTHSADSVEFGRADQVVKLDRTDSAACSTLVDSLPWR